MKANQILLSIILCFFTMKGIAQETYQQKLENLHEKIVRTQYSTLDSMFSNIEKFKMNIKTKDSFWIARYHEALGVYHQQKGDYDKAIGEQLKSLVIAENLKNPLLIAKANKNIGVVYSLRGDFEISTDYLFKARDLSYANKDTVTGVLADLKIGQTFWQLKEYKKAMEQVDKCIEIAETRKLNNDVLSDIYLEKGNMLLMYGKLDSSLAFYKKAEKLIYSTGHLEGIATVYSNIGAIYFYKNDFNKAIEYYKKSLVKAEEFKDKISIGIAKMNIGEAYYNINQFQKSEKELKESLSLFKGLKDKLKLMDNYYYLYELESKRNNSKKALEYFKLRIIYKDSVINENNLNKISSLQVKYETVEKEKQIAQQDLELQTQNATISSQRNNQLLLLGGLGFLILGGLLFYNKNKAKQKVALQKAVIKEKEKGFSSLLKASEDERKRISKDLHDGIGQEMAALKMAIGHVKNKEEDIVKKEELSKILNNCARSADEIRNISHQMMPRTLLENGLIDAIDDLLKGAFMYSKIEQKFEYFNISERFNEQIEISLYRVVQELISNIIKHANASEVNVLLYKQEGQLILLVEDNGIGMQNKSKKGHGVLNIKSRIDMIKGTINYEPSTNAGTSATIVVPL
ncbi:MAG: sensor histidine kinase [Polaribacter sp.]|uniref:tetratricopeptide repeat-containing sensor histidine kinase n=1 Tax=Polaribacter sp. TaxID=1920175 RepID=UPI002F360FF9